MTVRGRLAAAIGDLIATRETEVAEASPPIRRAAASATMGAAATPSPARRRRARAQRLAGDQRSLFGEILDWMFAPLLLLWPLSVAITFLAARSLADAPFDRSLRDRAVVLGQQVLFIEDSSRISLPRAAFELLRADDREPVMFQVTDAQGNLVAGEQGLPPPSIYDFPEPGRVKLRTADHRGTEVRIAYTYVSPVRMSHSASRVLVQVAEPLDQRNQLANEIIKGVIFPQFLILPLAVALVWFGLSRGLAPLKSMQQRIRARRPDDLSPLDMHDTPEELVPLVDSFNDLLRRLNQNLATQRRFLADAAHQMKTPLAGIRTQAELAERQTDAAERARSLSQLSRSSARAAHMVDQLLALARTENIESAAPFERTNLAAIARDAVADRAPLAVERNIDIGFESDGDAWVTGRPVLLAEMLDNLIDNALRYTPGGGIVTTRIRRLDDGILLEVEDNGRGIAPVDREFIFERFYRVLDAQTEGSGLGLAIVREIVAQHDAWIEVRDGLPWPPERGRGTGTAFVVHFPAAPVVGQQQSFDRFLS
ncbi:MAG: sensor histidine kinase N-terminal domain-containing protein [Pseudomonadota bacterium]|nr:sensor histidine kinase N-terminal domain-containing protein [Pseudomonadota bacterium]